APDAIPPPDLRVDVGERSEAAGDRWDIKRSSVAIGALAAFDRDDHDVGLRDRERGLRMEDDGGVAVLARPVEEGQRGAHLDPAQEGQRYRCRNVPTADDRAAAT